MDRDEQELQAALRALRCEDDDPGARPHVQERVMRAWDTGHARTAPRPRIRPAFGSGLALAASLLLTAWAGYWWVRRSAEPPSPQTQALEETMPTASPSLSYEALAWLDPDPASLQIVRLRVPSAMLAAQGYAVSDPGGDGTVDIEMIVGADGVARSVRVAPGATVIY